MNHKISRSCYLESMTFVSLWCLFLLCIHRTLGPPLIMQYCRWMQMHLFFPGSLARNMQCSQVYEIFNFHNLTGGGYHGELATRPPFTTRINNSNTLQVLKWDVTCLRMKLAVEMRCHTAFRRLPRDISQIKTHFFFLIWLLLCAFILPNCSLHIFWNEQKRASDQWKLEMYDICKKRFIFSSNDVNGTLYWM